MRRKKNNGRLHTLLQGRGDSTKERHQQLEQKTVDDVFQKMEKYKMLE
jgi:hypothetical protein